MAVSVVMPALEMAQESGKLIAWLKKEGDQVRKGEMLLEVETDKAVVEVEAASDGILAGITAKPGDVIPVGHTIAWLVGPGESVPAAAAAAAAPAARRVDGSPAAAASVAADVGAVPAQAPRISPKARRLAQEQGVDISRVKGSGAGGEILADDIVAAAAQVRLKPDTTTAPKSDPPTADRAQRSYVASSFSRTDTPVEPLTTIGRLMAERTTQSWTTVPHFFVIREVDAAALESARQALLPEIDRSHGIKVTHTDLLVGAVARVLRRHRRLNASWTPEGIAVHADINIALAMAVENAVVTGTIPRADAAAIGDIAARRHELAERARAGRLQPNDVTGATFTISNLGMFGVDAFTAIVVPPQAAILAVGAIADRVVALNGAPAVRAMLTMTLSCDHRVVDGARAAEFMRDVVGELTALKPHG